MPYSKQGWTDSWELEVEEDGETQTYELKLQVVPAPAEEGPAHAFIATLTVARYVLVGDDASAHSHWEPRDPKPIHHSEHLSIAEGVVAIRDAAKRAEIIRRGPDPL